MVMASENMAFEKVDNVENQFEVKWSKKPFWDYKILTYQFYNCGFSL